MFIWISWSVQYGFTRIHCALLLAHILNIWGVDLSSIIVTPIWEAVNNWELTVLSMTSPLILVHFYSLHPNRVLLRCDQISDECALFMIWYGMFSALSSRVEYMAPNDNRIFTNESTFRCSILRALIRAESVNESQVKMQPIVTHKNHRMRIAYISPAYDWHAFEYKIF